MRSRTLGAAAALGLAVGLLAAVAAAGPASAATCPTVTTTTVTPPPSPGVDWSGCDLSGAFLNNSDLDGANLTGANLTGAALFNATLTSANLAGATLTGATLTEVTSGSVSGTPAALPADWSLSNGYLIGPDATLLNADLSGADLTNADLSDAELVGADLHAATLTGADFSGALMTDIQSGGLTTVPAVFPPNFFEAGGFLIGPTADVNGANLTGVTMNDVDDVSGATFVGADFAGDDLAGAYTFNADFANANLSNVNLSGDDLTGDNFAGTKLAGANFSEIESGGVTGPPASLPGDWELAGGYLIGENDDLIQANLSGVNLSGYDMTGDDLFQAELTSANLTGTNLEGAYLASADINQAIWSDTICPDNTNSDANADWCGDDLTPAPFASPVLAGTAGSSGWYTSPVTVTWHWADYEEDLQPSCPQTSATSVQGSTVTISAACANTVGISATATATAKVDTTPPAVSVTGVASKRQYVIGSVPKAGCRTTDAVSGVGTAAAVKVTTTGSHGTGAFTATCSGAADKAGNAQAKPISISYAVVDGMAGFAAPAAGATLARSGKSINVEFRLTDAKGTAISASIAAALGREGKIRATLAGPAIRAVTSTCGWSAARKEFTCAIKTPAGLRTGRSHRYIITATENLGSGARAVPAVGKSADPETIYFR